MISHDNITWTAGVSVLEISLLCNHFFASPAVYCVTTDPGLLENLL
jgi:hypothetical protein